MEKKPVKILCILLVILLVGKVCAQNILRDTTGKPPPPPKPKPFPPRDTILPPPVPYPYLRQADVMWSERIWRQIDLREKMNLPLYYPLQKNEERESLWDIIKAALKGGEITAYQFDLVDLDNTFSVPMNRQQVLNAISHQDTLLDENGNKKVLTEDVTSDKIRAYMLKEDWFFDKQRSVMDVRILGIAPMAVQINANTGQEDTTSLNALFWLYFPQLRPLFAQREVFNTHNNFQWLTYDALLMKRMFSSYIIQASNVFNRPISGYAGLGIERLLEGEKIKHKMFAIEHDMWQY